MIVKPTSEELSKKAGNSYKLVNVIAKRARQIQNRFESIN